MKKIIAVLLCAVMLFAFTACGEDAAVSSNSDTSSVTESKAEVSSANSSKSVSSVAPVVKKNPVKIMPMGDSLTQGGDHNNSGAYRKPLGEMLDKSGLTYQFVGAHNWSKENITNGQVMQSGYGGIDVFGLEKKLPDMAKCDPDIILLMVGRNDNTRGITGEYFSDLLSERLLDKLYEMFPDVTIYVGSIPPSRAKKANENSTGDNDEWILLEHLNDASVDKAQGITFEATKAMVEKRKANGDKIEFVDMRAEATGITYEDFAEQDFTHPLMSGYEKIATQWYNAIEKQAFELEKQLNP